MNKKKGSRLFDMIAPIYGLFFNHQRHRYSSIIRQAAAKFDITNFQTAIDVGCGTGAFCLVLHDQGVEVTGIDPAAKMLKIASRKTRNKGISFLQGNALEGLPFADNSFEIAVSSYVAHGLRSEERSRLYSEMGRVASKYVIFHDYNEKRAPLTTIIEWLEGGDYFHFIKHAEPEMRECLSNMQKCFSEVRVINVDKRASWYICRTR